jgi:Zn-dependent protease
VFRNAVRITSLRGIDIRIDISWLAIAAIITWSFWAQFRLLYLRDTGPALVMAVLAAMLFFSSVLIHEMAHALEAQRRGVTVAGITLFMFGGVTESKFDVRRPGDEFALTIVGPLSSLLLAGVFWVVAAGTGGGVAEVAGLLGWINLALAVFNLIPGAPLDGGRILRAAIWKATGDRHRSIRIAAHAGRYVGLLLIVLGVVQVLFVAGGIFGGLWLALIGMFLRRGAEAELVQSRLVETLEGVRARDMAVAAPPVWQGEPVEAVLSRWAMSDGPGVIPVTDGGDIVGVVPVEDGARIEEWERRSVSIGTVMVPVRDLPVVDADAAATTALESLDDRGVVVVSDRGRPVGLIDTERFLSVARRRARTLSGRRPAPPHEPV